MSSDQKHWKTTINSNWTKKENSRARKDCLMGDHKNTEISVVGQLTKANYKMYLSELQNVFI